MTLKLTGFLFFLVLAVGLSCCDHPTEPKDNPGIDTTSHNFVWRVDTIGGYLSVARDVAIVNENDIWVVGEFYKNHSNPDSIDADRYGLCIWNGKSWQLTRVPYRFNGIEEPNSSVSFASIFVLKSDFIWLCSLGRTPIRFKNGIFDSFSTHDVTTDRNYINKIWAKDENNIWFVGDGGTILYFNGSTFSKIPYSPDVDFVDIWGDETGMVRVVANKSGTFTSSIVRISTGAATLEFEGLNQAVNSQKPDIYYTVWWKDATTMFLGADNGFFKKHGENYQRLSSYHDNNPIQFQVFYAKGYANNDVFVVGNYGQVAHYNGKSVHLFTELPITNIHSELKALSVKKDLICAVGSTNGKGGIDQDAAYIVLGKRVK
ncbi:MAG: hypothetical protein J0L62_08845 [Bacteroidetes bacterium]|nr:hypothetical protein [Bacteroidota bacterium]